MLLLWRCIQEDEAASAHPVAASGGASIPVFHSRPLGLAEVELDVGPGSRTPARQCSDLLSVCLLVAVGDQDQDRCVIILQSCTENMVRCVFLCRAVDVLVWLKSQSTHCTQPGGSRVDCEVSRRVQ